MEKSNNKMVVALLAVLIVAVLCVGGYFIVKDMNGRKNDDSSQREEKKSDSKTDEKTSGDSSSDKGSDSTETSEIEAGITYAEVRGNDFYVEVQANGQVTGTCEISVLPTNGGQGHHDTDDLEVRNKVSICDEDFSLKGMNPGEHLVKVVIRATDGRTKTLEKTVNI